eukprot:364087-Chlamydomonas_euryale.AAC.3
MKPTSALRSGGLLPRSATAHKGRRGVACSLSGAKLRQVWTVKRARGVGEAAPCGRRRAGAVPWRVDA